MRISSLVALRLLISLLLGSVFSQVQAAETRKLMKRFSNESKVGVVITTGNSNTQTYDLSQKNSYAWDANEIRFFATYLRATSKGVESARRWSLGSKYERSFADRWAFFVAETVEGDTYAGFLQRYNTDLGGKYYVFKDDEDRFFFEAGYRHQYENQKGAEFKSSSFARLYAEFEHEWNAIVSNKVWVEYLQNIHKKEDRFINTEASLTASLTQILSVQLSYLVRYRNLPPSAAQYKTDSTLIAAVLAHF